MIKDLTYILKTSGNHIRSISVTGIHRQSLAQEKKKIDPASPLSGSLLRALLFWELNNHKGKVELSPRATVFLTFDSLGKVHRK